MFSMLSHGQNPEKPAEAASKPSRPPSRKTSVDLGQSGVPKPPVQCRKLNLPPRTIPTEPESTPQSAEPSENGDADDEPMSEASAMKKIAEDCKEFFAVRNLEEAEDYF
jgi:translation initiation factor 4G